MALTYATVWLYNNEFNLIVVILKPFLRLLFTFRKKYYIRTSTIDSFATFILLSNVKLLSTCLDILIPVNVYRFKLSKFSAVQSRQVFSDATLTYFGPKHLPYAVIAISVYCIFVFLPVFILFLYPFKFFRNIVNRFPSRCILFFNTFVDSFQGCYKDGTEPGSRDYRWVSVLPFTSRWLCIITYALILNSTFFPLITIATVLIAIFLIVFDPLQKTFQSMSFYWIVHTLLMAIFWVSAAGTDIVQITGQSITLLHVFYMVYAITAILPTLGIIFIILQFLLIKSKNMSDKIG